MPYPIDDKLVIAVSSSALLGQNPKTDDTCAFPQRKHPQRNENSPAEGRI